MLVHLVVARKLKPNQLENNILSKDLFTKKCDCSQCVELLKRSNRSSSIGVGL